ncbi:LLM class flavin-dependent oxidoreductase [Agrococcus sp. 1P02AA]|uniref:LLM class flavin-dependent oxidoreductase n=1 Tax=Agrococcus sp. 1P02AA TaxID=3132259 RepID=UPI0039A6234D
MDAAPVISLILPPDLAPERVLPAARAAEAAGVGELWLWEDCFAESGIAPAAAILAATTGVRVGIGLLPVPLRNVGLAAMEIATIERMFPGRLLPGIGHGVLDWMGQAGVRAASPLTLLREYATALRALLDGDEVSVDGRYVQLDRVQLRWRLEAAPPVLMGAERPKTLALAGQLGDGVILVGDRGPDGTREALRTIGEARAAAGVDRPFQVVQFGEISADATEAQVRELAAAYGDAGATRVPLLAVDAEGKPDSGDGIMRLAETIGAALA